MVGHRSRRWPVVLVVVAAVGSVAETGDLWEPYQLIDATSAGWRYATSRPIAGDHRRGPGRATLSPGPLPAATGGPATSAHGETVVRGCYALHLDAGSGPMVNPFPLVRERREQRAPRASQSDRAVATTGVQVPLCRQADFRRRTPRHVAHVPRCRWPIHALVLWPVRRGRRGRRYEPMTRPNIGRRARSRRATAWGEGCPSTTDEKGKGVCPLLSTSNI